MTSNNNNQQFNNAIYMFIVLCLFVIALAMCSCNAEKKALKPYKAVNSDVDSSFKAKKKELIARVCAVNFPIEIKTIKIDSVVNRIVKVTDNALINKLKAQLAKGCPTLNIDSILNDNAIVDTIYIDHYHTTTSTVKDTVGSYFKAQIENELRGKVNDLTAENTSLNKHISDITNDLNNVSKERNKWRLYFFLLLICGIAYKAVKIYLKAKI